MNGDWSPIQFFRLFHRFWLCIQWCLVATSRDWLLFRPANTDREWRSALDSILDRSSRIPRLCHYATGALIENCVLFYISMVRFPAISSPMWGTTLCNNHMVSNVVRNVREWFAPIYRIFGRYIISNLVSNLKLSIKIGKTEKLKITK